MKTDQKRALSLVTCWKFRGWIVWATAVVSFAAGSLISADLARLNKARADSNRVFELMIYHTLPGKAPALESIFKDDSKLMAQHGLDVVGFWVPDEDPAWKDRFIYVVAFPGLEEAKKRWQEIRADPASRPYVEAAKPLIEKVGDKYNVDEVYMRPTAFSQMK
jgi:hypothetical protein